ncbi:tRNA (adenosine(37)-N6)-threonylcarbamoyltransferase complex ATPase subunit type 1 TsaE, partial [Peribacillus sp. SIMBA_075]
MSKYEITTKSSEETQRLSEKLGRLVKEKDVIILEGD